MHQDLTAFGGPRRLRCVCHVRWLSHTSECAGPARSSTQWPGEPACYPPGYQDSSYSKADGSASGGGHSFPPVRQAAPVHQRYDSGSRDSAPYVGGHLENSSFGQDRGPSSGYREGSFGAGMGASEPVEYATIIPDPLLRQSFDQNVEEARSSPSRAPHCRHALMVVCDMITAASSCARRPVQNVKEPRRLPFPDASDLGHRTKAFHTTVHAAKHSVPGENGVHTCPDATSEHTDDVRVGPISNLTAAPCIFSCI